MSPKKIIVVGYRGQDGTLLMQRLQAQGHYVFGVGRGDCSKPAKSDFSDDVCISSSQSVYNLVSKFRPDEVYYLAAAHTSAELADGQQTLREQFETAHSTHVVGLLNFLAAIADSSAQTRLFYASSSLIFSGKHGELQDEDTPRDPNGVYGVTKAQGMWLCSEYRTRYNVFASVGILYNHESHLRATRFLTAKIIRAAIRIARGADEKLEVGNLSARVDWGYASDFVAAFQSILSVETPEDFIVATGEAHTVQDFIDIVFSRFDLNPTRYVIENRGMSLRSPLAKIGDIAKLKKHTGWQPSMGFRDFVLRLVEDHLAHMPVDKS